MAMTIKRGKTAAAARIRRQVRGRKKIAGTPARPRLVVSRSSRHLYVQVVDDTVGKTVASASTMEADLRSFEGDKTAKAKKVGELVAARQERRDRGRGLRPRRQQVPRSRRGHRRGRPRRWAVPVSDIATMHHVTAIEMRNI